MCETNIKELMNNFIKERYNGCFDEKTRLISSGIFKSIDVFELLLLIEMNGYYINGVDVSKIDSIYDITVQLKGSKQT